MANRRLFIAIPLSQEVKGTIEEAVNEYHLPGKRVPIDNLHITVHFLGDTPKSDIPFIEDHVDNVTKQTKCFYLWPEKIDLKKSRSGWMVWVVINKSQPFIDLVHKLRTEFDPEKISSRISPHITLARLKQTPVEDSKVFPIPLSFEPIMVNNVVLWQSRTEQPNAVYTSLKEFSLQK
ncbi:MAG: RNA 2',3'-cyclic phosphodiesterase [Balneolales bacterium]